MTRLGTELLIHRMGGLRYTDVATAPGEVCRQCVFEIQLVYWCIRLVI